MKKTILKSFALFTLIGMLNQFSLQAQSVTVYKNHDLKGDSKTYTSQSPNLHDAGFGDNISSVLVRKGTKVTLYEHKGYSGQGLVLYSGVGDEKYNDIEWWNDDPSSMKVETYNPNAQPTVVFYESNDNFKKHQLLVAGSYKKSELLCNDCFSRLSIPDGVTVDLYENDNYSGKVKTLTSKDGALIKLGDHNWNDKVTSMKITNSKYALKTIKLSNERTVKTDPKKNVGAKASGVNRSSGLATPSIELAATHESSITESYSHEISHTIEIGVSSTFTAGVEGVSSTSVTTEITNALTNSITHGKENTTTYTQEWAYSLPVEVRPGCKSEVIIFMEPVTLQFDVERIYVQIDSNGNEVAGGQTYKEKGTMKIKRAKEFTWEADDDCESDNTSVVNTNTNTSTNSNNGNEQLTTKGADSNSTKKNINGQNVCKVSFNTNQGLGYFKLNTAGKWVEGNEKTSNEFSFKETGRDEWSVYLRDDSRKTNIQLDLHRKKVMYSTDSDGASKELYNIITVE